MTVEFSRKQEYDSRPWSPACPVCRKGILDANCSQGSCEDQSAFVRIFLYFFWYCKSVMWWNKNRLNKDIPVVTFRQKAWAWMRVWRMHRGKGKNPLGIGKNLKLSPATDAPGILSTIRVRSWLILRGTICPSCKMSLLVIGSLWISGNLLQYRRPYD